MKIIKPRFEILNPIAEILDQPGGVRLLKFIEMMGRISHKSEDRQTADSWQKFIPSVVMQHGDWSIVEHASATVLFRVDRGVTHELVRHRLFSFTQESTRFVNGRKSYPNGLEFIYPSNMPINPNTVCLDDVYNASWVESVKKAEETYLSLLDRGIRPQEARSVLPNALAATIAVTGNLRNWRHFFLMRTSKETHPDMRIVTVPLLEEFKKRIPLLYDDILSNERQIDNLKKPR